MRIGTRGSALALAQAGWVAERIGGELVEITTAGDLNRAAGDKSRWTGALEGALVLGEIDLAVHSAKDVPGELGDGLELVAAAARLDSADVLCGAPSLAELPDGARVGTSALRRRAQLLAARPDLEIVELRGNVDTRLRKLATGEVDALVLARAGLERLGRLDEAGGTLKGEVFVPAAGQGTLVLEARQADGQAAAAAAKVQETEAWACLRAERALVRTLGADCHSAVGARANFASEETTHVVARGRTGEARARPVVGDEAVRPGNSQEEEGRRRVPPGGPSSSPAADTRLHLTAFVGARDGSEWIHDELDGDAGDPEHLGVALAGRLLSAGAAELLAR